MNLFKLSAAVGILLLACSAGAQQSPAVPATKPQADMPIVKDKIVRPPEVPVRNLYESPPVRNARPVVSNAPRQAPVAVLPTPAMETGALLKAYERIISEQNDKIRMLEKRVSELEGRK
ncbi:MAG: hypothetical protein V4488_26360 [Pseudomonadota bacterium]